MFFNLCRLHLPTASTSAWFCNKKQEFNTSTSSSSLSTTAFILHYLLSSCQHKFNRDKIPQVTLNQARRTNRIFFQTWNPLTIHLAMKTMQRWSIKPWPGGEWLYYYVSLKRYPQVSNQQITMYHPGKPVWVRSSPFQSSYHWNWYPQSWSPKPSHSVSSLYQRHCLPSVFSRINQSGPQSIYLRLLTLGQGYLYNFLHWNRFLIHGVHNRTIQSSIRRSPHHGRCRKHPSRKSRTTNSESPN